MNKKLISVILFAGIGLTLIGCNRVTTTNPKGAPSADTTNSEATQPRLALGLATTGQLSTANPTRAFSAYDLAALNMMYEGLYRIIPDGTIQEGVATGAMEREGDTVTLHLKEDAKWSNNQSVTAQDFVYAWQQLVNPNNHNYYANVLDCLIRNAAAVRSGETPVDQLEVTALDNHTLQFTLGDESISTDALKQALAFPVLAPLPEAFIATINYDVYGNKTNNTLSNGPYLLSSWSPNATSWRFDRNLNYTNINHYPTNAISMELTTEATAERQYNHQILDVIPTAQETNVIGQLQSQTLLFNAGTTTKGKAHILQSETLRQILSQAIDKKALQQVVGEHTEITNTINPFVEATPATNETDLQSLNDQLMTFLKEKHYEGVEFTIQTDNSALSKAIASELKTQWESKLKHVTIDISSSNSSSLIYNYFNHDYDILLYSSQLFGATKQYPFYYGPFINGESSNVNHTSFSGLEATLDPIPSDSTMLEWEKIIQNHALALPLLKQQTYYQVRTTAVNASPYKENGYLFDFYNMVYTLGTDTTPIPESAS